MPTSGRLGSAGHDALPERSMSVRLGLAIRHARHAAGLTLGEVEAQTAGAIKATVLSAHERGSRPVPLARLEVLAGLYGVRPSDLLARAQPRSGTHEPVVVDLVALARSRNGHLRRVVEDVQRRRRETAHDRITIRRGDLALLAPGSSVAVIEQQLRVEGLLVVAEETEG